MSKFKKEMNGRYCLRGMTLIETLIYSALIVMMLSAALIAAYRIIDSSSATQTQIMVQEEANFLLRKIAWALSGVQTINTPPIGATSSTLSVSKANFSSNPLVFDLDSGNLRLKQGMGSSTILNSQNIAVTNLVFNHIAASSTAPEAVKVDLTVNTKAFSTTIYLRK